MKRESQFAFALVVLVPLAAGCAVQAADPQPSAGPELVVRAAEPGREIRHGVDWRGQVRASRGSAMLVGPVFLSAPSEAASSDSPIIFSWYKIDNAKELEPKRVTIKGQPSDAPGSYSVGRPVYFLSLSQMLGDGAPADAPEEVGHYVAYEIVGSKGGSGSKSGMAKLLCLPVEEWHHHEYFAPNKADLCWIAYESKGQDSDETTVSTLDQFGLNTLELGKQGFVCKPAAGFKVVTE